MEFICQLEIKINGNNDKFLCLFLRNAIIINWCVEHRHKPTLGYRFINKNGQKKIKFYTKLIGSRSTRKRFRICAHTFEFIRFQNALRTQALCCTYPNRAETKQKPDEPYFTSSAKRNRNVLMTQSIHGVCLLWVTNTVSACICHWWRSVLYSRHVDHSECTEMSLESIRCDVPSYVASSIDAFFWANPKINFAAVICQFKIQWTFFVRCVYAEFKTIPLG